MFHALGDWMTNSRLSSSSCTDWVTMTTVHHAAQYSLEEIAERPNLESYLPKLSQLLFSRKPFSDVNKALSKWKELTSPRKVERKAENMPAGV